MGGCSHILGDVLQEWEVLAIPSTAVNVWAIQIAHIYIIESTTFTHHGHYVHEDIRILTLGEELPSQSAIEDSNSIIRRTMCRGSDAREYHCWPCPQETVGCLFTNFMDAGNKDRRYLTCYLHILSRYKNSPHAFVHLLCL